MNYADRIADNSCNMEMVFVESPGERGYWFGEDTNRFPLRVKSFYMAKFPVTHALWEQVMGQATKPGLTNAKDEPVIHVSWEDVCNPGGFLDRINQSDTLTELKKQLPVGAGAQFRLPSEAEWEYAARGGKHWRENFLFSGSDNIGDVGWYKQNSGCHTHTVGLKAPNQLGIHDMCGNVWEWCQDIHVRDTNMIPRDGSPYLGKGDTRILRGGCHHNGGVHCTVFKRYEIIPDAKDECIGFRLVLGINSK